MISAENRVRLNMRNWRVFRVAAENGRTSIILKQDPRELTLFVDTFDEGDEVTL